MSSPHALPLTAPRTIGPPLAIRGDLSPFVRSTLVWLALMVFLVTVELFIIFVGGGLELDPRAPLFEWPVLLGIGLVGLLGIWLSHRTGFPSAWDIRVSNRQRFLYPTLFGLAIALVEIVVDTIFHGTQLFRNMSGLAAFNAPFPGSLLFYPGGAILVEVIYRLLPLPLLLWLVSNVALRGRGQLQVFWALALLTSFQEPISQTMATFQAGFVGLAVSLFGAIFALNLGQAVFFRRYGFLAAVIARVAMYLVWHIVYGNFICAC
jgi:hypothetical protein